MNFGWPQSFHITQFSLDASVSQCFHLCTLKKFLRWQKSKYKVHYSVTSKCSLASAREPNKREISHTLDAYDEREPSRRWNESLFFAYDTDVGQVSNTLVKNNFPKQLLTCYVLIDRNELLNVMLPSYHTFAFSFQNFFFCNKLKVAA